MDTTNRKRITNKAPGAGWWFPDATRFVSYSPDTNDKTILNFLHIHLYWGLACPCD